MISRKGNESLPFLDTQKSGPPMRTALYPLCTMLFPLLLLPQFLPLSIAPCPLSGVFPPKPRFFLLRCFRTGGLMLLRGFKLTDKVEMNVHFLQVLAIGTVTLFSLYTSNPADKVDSCLL